MTKKILVFGDSNVWGYIPNTLSPIDFTYKRFSYSARWTNILQRKLGEEFKVIEEGLPGRTIMTNDPGKSGLNGMNALNHYLVREDNLDCVIILLGTNDLKKTYQLSANQIAEQMKTMCTAIKKHKNSIENKTTQVMIIAPPMINKKTLAKEFISSYSLYHVEDQSLQVAYLYKQLAELNNYLYCDASKIVTGKSDGLHLNQESQIVLADKINLIIRNQFSNV